MSVAEISTCRACHVGPLEPLFSLGEQYVIDFLKPGQPDGLKAPLELVKCKACDLVQLKHSINRERLFNNFWYQSGLSKMMVDDLRNIVSESMIRAGRSLKPSHVVVDIGANDGTLLREYPDDQMRIGFEPSQLAVLTDNVINDFFTANTYFTHISQKARIITATAMFYDLEDPNTFLEDVRAILDDEGVFVVQQNYLPSMLRNNGFDNIVHEHLEYYSFQALRTLLSAHQLEIFDAELNDVNGGSLRAYICHKGKRSIRDGVERIWESEWRMGLDTHTPYDEFYRRVLHTRSKLIKMLKAFKNIYVLGAGTRGNTVLQYCGIDTRMVKGAVDKNPAKWGLETTGGRIPIMKREDAFPDHFLILPVHFLSEFMQQEDLFLRKTGDFIVPLPEPRLIR